MKTSTKRSSKSTKTAQTNQTPLKPSSKSVSKQFISEDVESGDEYSLMEHQPTLEKNGTLPKLEAYSEHDDDESHDALELETKPTKSTITTKKQKALSGKDKSSRGKVVVKEEDVDLDALVAAATMKFEALVNASSSENSESGDDDIFTTARVTSNDSVAAALGIESKVNKAKNPMGLALSIGDFEAEGRRLGSAFLSAKTVRSTLHDREAALEAKATAVARATGDLPAPFQPKEKKRDTAGKRWFDLPAPKLTPELKMDLTLLGMKNLLDKKHFYRREKGDVLPKYFHVGTEVGSAEDMYSGFGKRHRQGMSFTEAILNDQSAKEGVKQRFDRYVSEKLSRRKVKKTKIG